MARTHTWTLTDTAADVWLDDFRIDNTALGPATPHAWSVRKRTLRGGLRDGVETVTVDNGQLSFVVLPTRGMGLWRGSYRGLPLGWRSPVQGPVHPKFVAAAERGGLGWLRGFDEWLCRCGLAANGPPGEDVVATDGATRRAHLTLHGRIANLPAHFVEVQVDLDAPFAIRVMGKVVESELFGPDLLLTTTYTTHPGSNRVEIRDTVENRSATAAEMQLLYHCNLGPPFLEAGGKFLVPIRELAPLTPRAAEGIDDYDTYLGPTPGYAEQVYGADAATDAAGRSLAALTNAAADRAVVLRWNRRELPCFTVWKNTGPLADGYVTGLEPATGYPNFKTFERQQGRVKQLGAGDRWECSWSIEVYDTAAEVAAIAGEVAALQTAAPAVIHRAPRLPFSPT
jgi:hypothetical protein